MARKKLPIGIQTFREIREDNCYYVDKTGYALQMATEGKSYFLSRPRRFGKSLFLDTLAELFAGNEALFTGLYVHDKWDWRRKAPVVRIGFAEGVLRSRDALLGEIASGRAVSSRGRFNPRGVKRKMSNFNLRHRGAALHLQHQPQPVLNI